MIVKTPYLKGMQIYFYPGFESRIF